MIGSVFSHSSRFDFTSYAPARAHSAGYMAAAQKAAQPQTPVQPVEGVRKATNEAQAAIPKTFGLSVREGADPVEMAVRMRIQYVDQPTAAETVFPSAAVEEVSVSKVKSPEELEAERSLKTVEELEAEKALEEAKELEAKVEEMKAEAEEKEERKEELSEEECQTCERRKYQDGSDDPSVSFKTAGHIDPSVSASVVRGHEMEHVVNNRAKAQREDREIISQSVTLHSAICPECGTVYTSGGTTRTVMSGKKQEPEQQLPGQEQRVPFFAVA